MARSEYTRLRDIAQKRLGRLISAGLAQPGISFPKLRELKTEAERFQALQDVRKFVQEPTRVKEVRSAGNIVAISPAGIVVDDPKKIARREKQRQARQARREAIAKLTPQQQSMLKGAKTLGMPIKTKDIPAFVAYMEYRFSQYSDSRFYLFADYAEDFGKLSKSHSKDSILSDFERFRADYESLHDPVDATGYSAMEFQNMWNSFIND